MSPKFFHDNQGANLGFSVGNYLKEEKVMYNDGTIINIYIVFKLSLFSSSNITLDNCLFGAVAIENNSAASADEYKYSAYGVSYNSQSCSHKDSGKNAKDLTTFGADLSNSSYSSRNK